MATSSSQQEINRKRRRVKDGRSATSAKRTRVEAVEKDQPSINEASGKQTADTDAKPVSNLQVPLNGAHNTSKEHNNDHRENKRREKLSHEGQQLEHTAQTRRDSDGTNGVAHSNEQSRSLNERDAVVTSSKSSWTLAPPAGGRFLQHDPAFVRNGLKEEFLISAVRHEVQVLALATSLLICTHTAPDDEVIQAYALDTSNHCLVHVAYESGLVETWDWESDNVVSQTKLDLRGHINAIASASIADNNSLLFSLSARKSHSAIYQGNRRIYRADHKLDSLEVLGNAAYIVARGSAGIVIGSRSGHSAKKEDFSWIELPALTSKMVCSDARIVISPAQESEKSKKYPTLSLAVGHDNGQIHLYDDISHLFKKSQMNAKIVPRILHWHRHSVCSVKFSRDGVYLISGGKETVLVLWQLGTGKKQFLPHLTSTINRIVVNDVSDRYALQMGDNSIMVLSTSELKPVANFAGLQIFFTANKQLLRTACALHPKRTDQLLMAVQATDPGSDGATARPYLQTFDVRTSRHLSRQALTRNNVTDFNEGFDRVPIQSPDVAHIAISHDGEWLVTADEWMPPKADLMHLAADDSGLTEEQKSRREVYLKFWHWDAGQSLWTLTTRADAPHARSDHKASGAGRILAAVPHPTSVVFVTVGEDRVIKFWSLKKRRRHGVDLTDEHDNILMEWTCTRSTLLPSDHERFDSPIGDSGSEDLLSACATFCNDGSIVAVALVYANTKVPLVHFIDSLSGEIKYSRSGMADNVIAMGFIGQDLLLVSDTAIYQWDIIDNAMKTKLKLHGTVSDGKLNRRPLLAIDLEDKTFAVAIPGESSCSSKVVVYGAKSSKCLLEVTFTAPVEAILASKDNKGFTLIFADATTRTLLPSAKATMPPALPDSDGVQRHQDAAQEVDLDGELDIADVETLGLSSITTGSQLADVEDDRPVVRPEELANIFDVGPSFAMPPMRDMFQAVVGLFSRPPLTAAS